MRTKNGTAFSSVEFGDSANETEALMFCEPCKSAMVTRLYYALVPILHKRRKKSILVPMFEVKARCVECGTMEDVGHIV